MRDESVARTGRWRYNPPDRRDGICPAAEGLSGNICKWTNALFAWQLLELLNTQIHVKNGTNAQMDIFCASDVFQT
jgi:hypothetical protein